MKTELEKNNEIAVQQFERYKQNSRLSDRKVSLKVNDPKVVKNEYIQSTKITPYNDRYANDVEEVF